MSLRYENVCGQYLFVTRQNIYLFKCKSGIHADTRKRSCICIIRLLSSGSEKGFKPWVVYACTRARITVRRWAPDWPLVANGGPTAREVDVRTPRQHSDSSRSFLVVSATGSARGPGREHRPRNAPPQKKNFSLRSLIAILEKF